MSRFATAILDTFGFDYDHLYEFSYRSLTGLTKRIHHPYMQESPSSAKTLVGSLGLRLGQSMLFWYDFGDDWEFDVHLEAVKPERLAEGVKLLESHGEAPPQYPNWDDEDNLWEIEIDEVEDDHSASQ